MATEVVSEQQLLPTVQRSALDEFQRGFCSSKAPNIRRLAPAGSGKTQSLLWRCVEVHQRLDGKARFLVVNFTKAARDELRARLHGAEFRGVSGSVEATTLNSWGYRRVRAQHHSPRLLVSEWDRNSCIQNTLQPIWSANQRIASAMHQSQYRAGPALMLFIDRLKTLGFKHTEDDKRFEARLTTLDHLDLGWLLKDSIDRLNDLEVLSAPTRKCLVREAIPFWRAACASMIQQALFTMEDQKYVALLDLLQQLNERRFPVGGSRITHILVDEFQDINPLDLDLIAAMVDLNKAELTIVGDDDQAIYEWRGASPSYILNPKRSFGRSFETSILERNYRCPRNIVEASQKLIVHNRRRQQKRVIPMNPHNADVQIIEREKFSDSIDAVMEEVRSFLGRKPGKATRLAVVSRKRAQLIPYQILLASANIPFCAAEDLQVFLSNAFDALQRMLLTCANARTNTRSMTLVEDIVDLCNQVKRFPLKKAERTKLATHFRAARPRTYPEALDALRSYTGPLKSANEDGAMSHEFATRLGALLKAKTVAGAIEAVGGNFAGMVKDYGKAAEDIFYADPPFLYLAEFAKRYGDDFAQFLDDINLAKDTLAQLPDDDDGGATSATWNVPIHLMTALRAKGKEFDTVILLDVVDGIWPSKHAESVAQKEQERRVFYVAMTRAKQRLVLTCSKHIGEHAAAPSPYLRESGLR